MTIHPPRTKHLGELMTPLVVSIEDGATLREAAAAMASAKVGTVAIVENGDITGIVSERDLVTTLAGGGDPDEVRVAEVMSRQPRYLTVSDSVPAAAHAMLSAGIRHLPIIDECQLVGIVSLRDVTAALVESGEKLDGGALEVEQELSHPGG
ncbi:MAG TPA: CBS domain-containing protein [Acidimicrobiales bacterium]|nr:CBS domain-containing protein [Acidimicrobiales bacterium]